MLINHYDLVEIPSKNLDKFVETFRQAVRKHYDARKVNRHVDKIFKYFDYEVKIEKSELLDKAKKRPRALEPGTSRPPKMPKSQKIMKTYGKKSKSQFMKDSQKVRKNAPNKDSIAYGFVQNLRLDGDHDAAFVVEEIRKNPGELGPILKAILKKEIHSEKWTNLDVLANFFDQDMTVKEYNDKRKSVNETSGINAMPCYDIVYR